MEIGIRFFLFSILFEVLLVVTDGRVTNSALPKDSEVLLSQTETQQPRKGKFVDLLLPVIGLIELIEDRLGHTPFTNKHLDSTEDLAGRKGKFIGPTLLLYPLIREFTKGEAAKAGRSAAGASNVSGTRIGSIETIAAGASNVSATRIESIGPVAAAGTSQVCSCPTSLIDVSSNSKP